jgi:hypothetical protein
MTKFARKITTMIQIGDKVRFLNSVGGGVVKAFQGKNMVLVEDDNGFDFPITASECVVVGSGDASLRDGRISAGDLSAKPAITSKSPPKVEAKPRVIEETPGGERLNVFIAYLPVDPKMLMQTAYEAYFINESNYWLYTTCLSRSNNSYTVRFHALVEPNTKIFMEEFPKDDLADMERICIQLIAFKQGKPFALKDALSVELRLDTVKFYKLHCFVDNEYFDEPALIFPVIQADVAERALHVQAAELRDAMMRKKQDDARQPQTVVAKRSNVEPPVVEIDLHINQLLDNTNGMSAADILNHQLKVFRETLKQYAGQKGRQIVFIHGKGEGVLRTAIEKELRTHYKSCTFQDASFQEYGFGATLIKIR